MKILKAFEKKGKGIDFRLDRLISGGKGRGAYVVQNYN